MRIKVGKCTLWISYPFSFTFKFSRNRYWWNKRTLLLVDPLPKQGKKGGWIWYWGCVNIRYSDW